MKPEAVKFFEELDRKVEVATKDWPDWKHNVLRNSFRHSNDNPRPPIVEPWNKSKNESH